MTDSELKHKLANEHALSEGDNGNAEVSFCAGWDAARENPLRDEKRLWNENEELRKERNELRAEVERLKETLSYLPKVPTGPYEKAMAKEIIELRAEVELLNTKLLRTVSAAHSALLEMSAWLGVPEKKRHAQIERLMENVKFCAEHDLRHLDGLDKDKK